MRPQLIMTCFGIFAIGTILACIASGRWLLNGETNIFNALASFNVMTVQAGGVWEAPKTIGDSASSYFRGIITMLTWDYPYLQSQWALFIKIPLWVISIGVVWGLLQTFVTIIQGLVGMVRNFLPG